MTNAQPQPNMEPSTRVLTVPNVISAIRLALVPVFLVCITNGAYLSALAVLAVASLSDGLDGWLARRLRQVSNLGILLDPIADRLYILAALIGLAVRDIIPVWLVLVIVSRDVLLVILGVALWRGGQMGSRGEKGRFRRGAIPVSKTGKAATFLLLVGLPTLLLAALLGDALAWILTVGWVLTCAGALLYWLAGIDYARHTRDRVRASRW